MFYSTKNQQAVLNRIRANSVENIKLRGMQSKLETQRRRMNQLDQQHARLLRNKEDAEQLSRLRDYQLRESQSARARARSGVSYSMASTSAMRSRPLTASAPTRERFVQQRRVDQYYADYQAWLRQCAAINAHNQKVLAELERRESYRQVLKQYESKMMQGKLFYLKNFIRLKALEDQTAQTAHAEKEKREALGLQLEKLRWQERYKQAIIMGLQGQLK